VQQTQDTAKLDVMLSSSVTLKPFIKYEFNNNNNKAKAAYSFYSSGSVS